MRRTRARVSAAPVVLAASVGLVLALLVGCSTGDDGAYVERPTFPAVFDAVNTLRARHPFRSVERAAESVGGSAIRFRIRAAVAWPSSWTMSMTSRSRLLSGGRSVMVRSHV